jgi:flagellar biosynthesis chaperone FliJ
MKLSEVREVIRQAIAEAKEEKGGGLPKSGGKLVHLKKELDGLKKMKESLGSLQIAEGGEQQFVAEYAHMQKFVTELEKIKAAHAKLAEMLDKQISEVETKVSSETEKIKEMVGLIEKAPKKAAKKDDKKAPAKKDDKKAPAKKDDKKAPAKKDDKELNEAKKPNFVIPAPDSGNIEDDARYFQSILRKAGILAKVKANIVDEQIEVFTDDEAKARKVIEKTGYQIGWNN